MVSFALRDKLIDYQLAHLTIPPTTNPTVVRELLEKAEWVRVGVTLFAGLIYVWLIRRLRQGRRMAYLRVLWISIVGLAALGYLAVEGQFPVWMRMEQVVQALVLAALLYAITRPQVRIQFIRRPAGVGLTYGCDQCRPWAVSTCSAFSRAPPLTRQ